MMKSIEQSEIEKLLTTFFVDRRINREFYENVPEEKYDYRMVDTSNRKSDSVRESLIHQIQIQRKYIKGIKTGRLEFTKAAEGGLELPARTKAELLEELRAVDDEIVQVLNKPDIKEKQIEVPWSSERQSMSSVLKALHYHELLHTGWNIAVMDHLEMERYQALRDVWG
jgi:hypothetical protein